VFSICRCLPSDVTCPRPNGREVALDKADVNILERPGKSCLPSVATLMFFIMTRYVVFNAMVLDFVPLGKMFCVMNTTLSLRW
jgi:hypothetical protein